MLLLQWSFVKKPNGYWMNLDNVCNEICFNFKEYIDNGILPNYRTLQTVGIPPSVCSLFGLQKIADRLNCKLNKFWQARDGHFVASFNELVVDEYLYSRKIDHEPNVLIVPSRKYRCDQKINDYFLEIWGYSKRDNSKRAKDYNVKRIEKESLYSKFCFPLISIEKETLVKLSDVETKLDFMFEKLGFDVQRKEDFNMQLLTFNNSPPMGNKPNGYWTHDQVLQELREHIEQNGSFPTQQKLLQDGLSDLSGAISKFGGLNYFAIQMGYEAGKRPNRFWTISKIFEEIDSIGHFPSADQLIEMNRQDLSRAISKHGGFVKLRAAHLNRSK